MVASTVAEAEDCNIQVAVRGRPLSDSEDLRRKQRCATIEKGGAVQVGRSPADANHLVPRTCPRFIFDSGFNETSRQEELFEWVIPAVEGLFDGYNGSIMAYGQTGSGKTYTMGTSSTALVGDPEQHGVVPRAFARIANEVQARSGNADIEVRMSFVEVHDDSVKDLLADPGSAGEIMIREDARGEIVLVGANEIEVNPPTCGDMMQLLEQGSLARTTAATLMNATSSRSHAVLTVSIEQWLKPAARKPGMPDRVKAKLQLVDLAGSERNKRTQTTGRHFKESVNINQGLLALANCINVLSDAMHARPGAPPPHVPYRDHKLTRLLRNSLGGNARTFILACISTAPANFQETVSTLRYAARARNIRNTPVINAGVISNEDEQLEVISRMEREMEQVRMEIAGGSEAQEAQRLREANELLEERIRQLSHALRKGGGDAAVPSGGGCCPMCGGGGGGMESNSSAIAMALDGGDGDESAEAVLRRALRTKEVELERAKTGLLKDEEMFVALASEMQDLAWTNTKLQQELRDLKTGRA